MSSFAARRFRSRQKLSRCLRVLLLATVVGTSRPVFGAEEGDEERNVKCKKTVTWVFSGLPAVSEVGTYKGRTHSVAKDNHINSDVPDTIGGDWNLRSGMSPNPDKLTLAGGDGEPFASSHLTMAVGAPGDSLTLWQIEASISTWAICWLVQDTKNHTGQVTEASARGELTIKSGTVSGVTARDKEGKLTVKDASKITNGTVVDSLERKTSKKGSWSDPIVLELKEIETGNVVAETLYQVLVSGIQQAQITWDDTVGIVLDVPMDGSGSDASIEGGFNSSWITLSPGLFSARLQNGIFTTSGAFSGLPWQLTMQAGNVVRAQLLPQDVPILEAIYRVPAFLVIDTNHYQMSLNLDDQSDASASCCPPIPEVDGERDRGWVDAVSEQGPRTSAGDNTLGTIDEANGSELDVAVVAALDDTLYLFLGGNLQPDVSRLDLFFDSNPGGQNRLRGDNPSLDLDGLNRMGDDGSGNGLRFDAGFAADRWLGLACLHTLDGVRLAAHFAELPSGGGGTGNYLGQSIPAGDGVLLGGLNPYGIRAAVDNRNVDGVDGGCGPTVADSVGTGIEVAVPLAALGFTTGCIRVTAMLNNGTHDFLSNQVLAALPPEICSLGEPRYVDFDLIPGLQHFVICPAVVGIDPGASLLPTPLKAWPNPFRHQVRFQLPASASSARLDVFDVAGRHIKSFPPQAAGTPFLTWDGRADDGHLVSAGTYFVRFRAGALSRSLLLLRSK